jgi:nucleoside-diphosphate-sugar epimerase
MRVVITGGGGFLGRRLAARVLAAERLIGPSGQLEPVDDVVLIDVAHPSDGRGPGDPRVRKVSGDITDRQLMASALDRDDVSLFHLAAMVSAECEQDFDGAMRVNLDGARSVFEAARACRSCPRVIFTSSIAAFGGPAVAGTVGDDTKLTPETTYGALKAVGEQLVNDYTRRGFFDGRTARLPTVIIRPGRPNAAASSWVSSVFREPIDGQPAVVPIDLDVPVPVSGYATIVENLYRLHEADTSQLGADRAINFPAIAVTARQMIDALRATITDRTLGPITNQLDRKISTIFTGWAQRSEFEQALRLGLAVDNSLESIIHTYLRDYAGGRDA